MKVVFGILFVVVLFMVVLFLPAAILSLLLTQLDKLNAPLLSIWECWCFLTATAIVGASFSVASVLKNKE